MYSLKKSIKFHSLQMMIKKIQTPDGVRICPYGYEC